MNSSNNVISNIGTGAPLGIVEEPKKKRKKVDLPIVPIRNTADYQRMKLERLMANPDKPVLVPERPKEKKDKVGPPPEFVRNIMGSSAGAGSGEFHVYRHLRRKEYARQKAIMEKAREEERESAFNKKLEERKRQEDQKTAKKRAKRLKQKEKMKLAKRKQKGQQQKQSSSSSSSTSDSDDDNQKSTGAIISSITNTNDKDSSKEERVEKSTTEVPELEPDKNS